MSTAQADSYNANYALLKRIADELRDDSDEPDIDGLVPKVEQALQAYQICRQRLEQVEQLLNDRLAEASEPAAEAPPAAAAPTPSAPGDDELPF